MTEEKLTVRGTLELAKALEEIYKPEIEVDEEIQLEEIRNQWSWD